MSNLLRDSILVEGYKTQNLVNKYKYKSRPFLWESDAKLETFQKHSLYIGVFYKSALNSVKTLNRIFWAKEYWFKALYNLKFGQRIQNHFSGKARLTLKLFEKFFCFRVCEKSQLIVIIAFSNFLYVEHSTGYMVIDIFD